MGILQCFSVVLLCTFLLSTVVVHAQDQSGFISIDCGSPISYYTDEKTGINYTSYESFVSKTAISKEIGRPTLYTTLYRQLKYVRSFPEGRRNCYNFTNITKDTRYFIRATFLYGNYDGLNMAPTFDLHLGPTYWGKVEFLHVDDFSFKEIVHTPAMNYMDICLASNGSSTPFISALEIRPLKNSTIYTTVQGKSLAFIYRLDPGLVADPIRYPDDPFDRLWWPLIINEYWRVHTTETATDSLNYTEHQPPAIVMRTGISESNTSGLLRILAGSFEYESYIYLYFAELEKLNQPRQFNISLGQDPLFGPITLDYLKTTILYTQSPIKKGWFNLTFFAIGGSTAPPLINAIESYYEIDLSPGTNQEDVDAIMKIKSTYNIIKDWQGDPCSPGAYAWEGLDCDYYTDTDPPAIKSLNLSFSGLKGEISQDIANLKSLVTLDLSNNSLKGPVPEVLSQLMHLKVLNLAGNDLSGTIPNELLQRNNNGSLLLSISGNSGLCLSGSCNKKNFVAPTAASVAAFIVIVAVIAIIIWRIKRKKHQARNMEAAETRRAPIPDLKRRQFTYSELLSITNNFERVLGRGGFGIVYHGYLDEAEVAVKMLSSSSVQGYNEFQAEVKLLLRVHHRNLTALVGYCDERDKIGLIYEYMANGNLRERLSDENADLLSWKQRLQIALDAAQGLEYLHNGYRPPIIHRDLKTSNILLDQNLQAKISDFGLSRAFETEKDSHVKTRLAGTFGYVDPEFFVSGNFKKKSDVYSFGVILFEIITGQPVIVRDHESRTHIVQWVGPAIESADITGIIDRRLQGEFDITSARKAIEIAMSCVPPSATQMPEINHILAKLKECLAIEMESKTLERENITSNNLMSNSFEMSLPSPR